MDLFKKIWLRREKRKVKLSVLSLTFQADERGPIE